MGRLDNIIARNRRPNRLQERVVVSMAMGLIVLVIIGLAVFTDLGQPPSEPGRSGASGGHDARPAPGKVRRVDGVLLGTPPPRPAAR